VRFTDYPHYRIGHWYPGGRNPYLVENVKEDLGEPGEWYLDRPSGKVFYAPAAGEEMSALETVAPRLERLLTVTGDLETSRYVEHLVFRGLSFAHSAWLMPPHRYAEQYNRRCRQGVVDMPAAVELDSARHCRFERCSFAHIGAYALDFGKGCHRNAAVGNVIYDAGAGGVKVGWHSGPEVLDLPVIVAQSSRDPQRLAAMTWFKHTDSVTGNPGHPCMHADPVWPDIEPEGTCQVGGRLYFHDGTLDEFLEQYKTGAV